MISNIWDLKMELIKELSMLRYQSRCGELLVVPLHCQLYQALNRLSFSPIFQREFTPYKKFCYTINVYLSSFKHSDTSFPS